MCKLTVSPGHPMATDQRKFHVMMTERIDLARSMKKKMTTKAEETEEQKAERRCYSQYGNKENLSFDPLKELNLPANYDEVLDRFKKLQGERAMEALN